MLLSKSCVWFALDVTLFNGLLCWPGFQLQSFDTKNNEFMKIPSISYQLNTSFIVTAKPSLSSLDSPAGSTLRLDQWWEAAPNSFHLSDEPGRWRLTLVHHQECYCSSGVWERLLQRTTSSPDTSHTFL